MISFISTYSKDKAISERDAIQTFFQVILLKNIAFENARLIGGTALVLGHSNPRFSEDIDLSNVEDPFYLRKSIEKGANEIAQWMNCSFKIKPPTKATRTWKTTFSLGHGPSINLHVDSQPNKTFTNLPIVISYPGIAPFIFPSVSVEEIMADKVLALALRNYVGGRDLFDLWNHWLRHENIKSIEMTVMKLLPKKLSQRGISDYDLFVEIRNRLKKGLPDRVLTEWERYLPSGLKKKEIFKEIYNCVTRYFETVRI